MITGSASRAVGKRGGRGLARITEPISAQGTPFYRVMAHWPGVLSKFVTLRNAIWEEGRLEPSLKEEVRLLCAVMNQCHH